MLVHPTKFHWGNFAEGTRVRCRCTSNVHWYTSSIVQKNDDGTYTVAWDDGNQEDKIKAAKKSALTGDVFMNGIR